MTDETPPLNLQQLNDRLVEVARRMRIPVARARLMLCTLIVSQMLPDAVAIKGGMGVKLRIGEQGTRATADLDVSTHARGEEFERAFRDKLARGWGAVPASKGARSRDSAAPVRVAFTASVRAARLHDPGLAEPQYMMHPYRVSISFLGKAWAAMDVEVSDPEIDAFAHARCQIDGHLVKFGSHFGFGELQPVELVDLEYQIAQKVHAVTDPAYVRAHDLVDLQLLWMAGPDLNVLRQMCMRTFDFRNQQSWPPLPLRPMNEWNFAYSDARDETLVDGTSPILVTLEEARAWLGNTVRTIDEAPVGPDA